MGGGKRTTASVVPTALKGIQVQSSVAGRAIPRGWGTFRVQANLLWYGAFKATPVTSQQAGGKGGGAKRTQVTGYAYSASIVLGICQGPITDIRTIFENQINWVRGSSTAMAQAGLSLATGAFGQSVWGYLTTNFPTEARGYSGIAYCYAADYQLDTSGALPNFGFEVESTFRSGILHDCNPKDILNDFLPSLPFWDSSLVADLTDYGAYCTAVDILLSPVLDTQRQVGDFLKEIMQATNSEMVWSAGTLKVIPYGDTAVGGWTPNLTPAYDLTNDHFLPPSDGEDPVLQDIGRAADASNYIQVEYLNRENGYATQIAVAFDAANIAQYGRNPNPSPYALHCICEPYYAATAAQLLVQRVCNIRRTFRFALPGNFDALDPMDLVTLTTDNLVQVLVRLTKCKAAPDGKIECEAEEMLVGTAHAPATTSTSTDGYIPNYAVDPGSVATYALINPNLTVTGGDRELWIGAAGSSADWGGAEIWLSFDGGTSYGYSGEDVVAPARLGVTTATLASHADPDSTNTLSVNLSSSQGILLTASNADADNAVTLCMLDSELVSYGSAALTSAYHYNLTYLRRGLYKTTIASHSSGATFARIDDAIVKVPYQASQLGTVLYVKFRSFNIYGQALQDLSVCTPYSVTLGPTAGAAMSISGFTASAVLRTATDGSTVAAIAVGWTPPTDTDITGIRFDVRKSGGTTITVTVTSDVASGALTVFDGVLSGTAMQIQATPIGPPGRPATATGYLTVTTSSATSFAVTTINGRSPTQVTTDINTNASAIAAVNGQITIKVGTGNKVAGIQLIDGTAQSSGGGSPGGTIVFLAANVGFADPSLDFFPLSISGGNLFAHSMFIDSIVASTIVTSHIQSNQITELAFVSTGSTFTGNGTWQTILSTTITLTAVGDILAQGSLEQSFSAIPSSWDVELQIDGVTVAGGNPGGTVPGDSVAFGGGDGGYAAGNHTVTLKWNGDVSAGVSLVAAALAIFWRYR